MCRTWYHPEEDEIFKLTNPAAIDDDFHNLSQVEVLKSPDGGTQDDSKDTVRERMHGSIYPSKNDAKGVEENSSEIDVIVR